MSLDELEVPPLVDKARQKKKVVFKPKTGTDSGFMEKDAESLAEQNPEIASRPRYHSGLERRLFRSGFANYR